MGGMGDGEKAVLWGLHDDSAPSTGCCCPWRFRMQVQISHILIVVKNRNFWDDGLKKNLEV